MIFFVLFHTERNIMEEIMQETIFVSLMELHWEHTKSLMVMSISISCLGIKYSYPVNLIEMKKMWNRCWKLKPFHIIIECATPFWKGCSIKWTLFYINQTFLPEIPSKFNYSGLSQDQLSFKFSLWVDMSFFFLLYNYCTQSQRKFHRNKM